MGKYYVVSAALQTASKMFAPIFVIHLGSSALGAVVHAHQRALPDALELSNVEDAFDTADEMAAQWIAQHQRALEPA
jgi:hypothetical protein